MMNIILDVFVQIINSVFISQRSDLKEIIKPEKENGLEKEAKK